MNADRLSALEPLGFGHALRDFDCDVATLNDYLLRRALGDQFAGKSRTYVAQHEGRVVGYFSLAAASIEPGRASARAAKGQSQQPVPVILLARLAVDGRIQRRGLGGDLLAEALLKSVAAADIIGARIVLAHATDVRAKGFYLHHGFEPSPPDDLMVMMLTKDIRKTITRA